VSLTGMQWHRTPKRQRARQLLAKAPNGCTEALMLAQGFTVSIVAALVSDGSRRRNGS
jgi:hypothetical protein